MKRLGPAATGEETSAGVPCFHSRSKIVPEPRKDDASARRWRARTRAFRKLGKPAERQQTKRAGSGRYRFEDGDQRGEMRVADGASMGFNRESTEYAKAPLGDSMAVRSIHGREEIDAEIGAV
jgi:hypothetical protein